MIIGTTCILPEVRNASAKKVMDSLSEEQRKKLNINSDTESDASRAIANIIGAWAGIVGEEEEQKSRLDDVEYILSHIENDIMQIGVSEEEFNDMQEMYDNYMKAKKAFEKKVGITLGNVFGLYEIDREGFSSDEDFQKEVDAVKLYLSPYKDILFMQDISKDGDFAMTVVPRMPFKIDGSIKQNRAERALERIRDLSAGFSYWGNRLGFEARNTRNGKIALFKSEEEIPKGWEKTGRKKYSYNGYTFYAESVSDARDRALEIDTTEDYPVLSGFIGNQVDEVGRMFFNSESDLYDQETGELTIDLENAEHRANLEYVISSKLHNVFTLEGLVNLIKDFQKLQKDFEDAWGPGCKVFSSELTLFGATEEQDSYITGKPDLLVIDKKGIVHVIDMKTKRMKTNKEDYNEVFVGEYGEQDRRKYAEQISHYIRILQSYGLQVDEQPYVVLIDTWYDASDFGDNNKGHEDSRDVYKGTKKGKRYVDFSIRKDAHDNPENEEMTLAEYAAKTGYERENILDANTDVDSVLYIEPRLHLGQDKNMGLSEELAALRGKKDLKLNENISYQAQFDALSDEDQTLLSELGGSPNPSYRDVGQGVIRLSKRDIGSRPDIITEAKLRDWANKLMYGFFDFVELVSQTGETGRYRNKIEHSYKPEDLQGKSHAEIIRKLGIYNILNAVFAEHFATGHDFDFPILSQEDYAKECGGLEEPYSDDEGYEFENWEEYEDYKKDVVLRNWLVSHKSQFFRLGSSKLLALEKQAIAPKTGSPNTLKQDMPEVDLPIDNADVKMDAGDNESMDIFLDHFSEGLSDTEAWMLGQRNFSPKASLAQEIRLMFETIKRRDEKGNPVVDRETGFYTHINATAAVQAIAEIVQDCETIEQMEAALREANRDDNNWIQDVLDKINTPGLKGENLKAKFFQHFRKDALTYSVCKVTNRDGKRVVETTIINRKTALETITQSLGAEFTAGTVGAFKIPGSEKTLPILVAAGDRLVLNRLGNEKGTVGNLVSKEILAIKTAIDNIYSNSRSVGDRGISREERIAQQHQFILDEMKKSKIFDRMANVMQGIGLMVPPIVIENTFKRKIKGKDSNNAKVMLNRAEQIIRQMGTISKDKKEGLKMTLHGPIYHWYANLLQGLADAVQETVESSVYHDGKTWYSYTNPSRLGHIFRNLRDALDTYQELNDDTTFAKYMQDNYGRYTGWFKSVDGKEWLNDWLAQINDTKKANNVAREVLAHKVELSFIGNQYRNLGALGFLRSILHNYYGSKEDEALHPRARWFALPTMSNKPTNEFVRMLKYKSHKDIVDKVLMKTFQQECNRIADVLYHYRNHVTATDQMDLTDKKLKKAGWTEEQIEDFKSRIDNKSITFNDLMRLSHITSGAKFHFLWYMNNALLENPELGGKVTAFINGLLTKDNESYDASFLKEVRQVIESEMEELVKKEEKYAAEVGLFDKEVRTINGNQVEILKYQEEFGVKMGDPKFNDETVMREEYRDFVWNDIAANINIIQLTGGDLAYFGNSVNYQKRIAMMHSPGLHLINNPKYTDGYIRSIHISTRNIKSEMRHNTQVALDNYLENEMRDYSEADREDYRKMISIIVSGMDKIDVTDGQSYSCFTSMKKKLILQGDWDDEREEAYQAVIKGDFNIHHLGVLLQPIKPFVASDLAKYSGSPTMSIRKTPLQDKNSEYLIILAEALARGAGLRSKLVAISDFMEETAKRNPRRGIDTVHFDSVAKVGLSGIIDLEEFEENFEGSDEEFNEKLTEFMLGKVERKADPEDTQTAEYLKQEEKLKGKTLKPEELIYNTQFVDTIPLDDYVIQQEVPAHFLDHKQLYGSQIRILGISDIAPNQTFDVYGEEEGMSTEDLVEEYKNLHAENIRDSYKELLGDIGLESLLDDRGNIIPGEAEKLINDPVKKNNVYRRLETLLQKELCKDAKYGIDVWRACTLVNDDNGNVIDFLIPLLDPIQSKRIQMLINSIIKKDINKQRINGGPLVQATAYDKNLHIRFKPKNRTDPKYLSKTPGAEGTLMTQDEFAAANKELSEKQLESEFRKYLEKYQAGIAYYECYAPIPNGVLKRLMGAKRGKRMSFEEIKRAMPKEIWERLTTMIGYRIPTEDKYSMAPIKIVGFVPEVAGEVIMMPQEITYLTGSDFDIDKMYVMRRTFQNLTIGNQNGKIDIKELERIKDSYKGPKWKSFDDDVLRIIQNGDKIVKGDSSITLTSGIKFGKMSAEDSVKLDQFVDWWHKRMLKDTFSEPDINAPYQREKKGARDNRLIDIQWAVLTHEDTVSKLLNPGNFNEQKKIGRFIRIIKSEIYNPEKDGLWTWEDLSEKFDSILKKEGLKNAIQFLDDLLEDEDGHSVTLPSSKLYFQQQNMQGSQMVGIFANHNVSHAFMTFQKVGIDLGKSGEDFSFAFDGVIIGDPGNPTVLDPMKGFNGQLISKTIASFLAASVDTAKDPVLRDLNVNTFTGGVAMVLARLGFSTEQIGLLLSQPVIIDLADLYFKRRSDSYYSGDTAIREMADILGIDEKDLNTDGITDLSTLSTEAFIEHLGDDDYNNGAPLSKAKKEYQINILKGFNSLFKIARDLGELTFCTKFNSVNNAVGPTIADTLEDLDRVEKFIQDCETNCFFIDTDDNDSRGYTNPMDIISSDPILAAFYDTTIAREKGASEVIFKLFFPHYYNGFQNVVQYFKENYLKNEKMTAKMYNQFLDAYLYYLMTYKSSDGKIKPSLPYLMEDKKYLVENLVKEFKEISEMKPGEDREPNMLLDGGLGSNCLRIRRKDEFLGIDTLLFNSSLLDADAQEDVKLAWSELIQSDNKRIRRFGIDLFFYSLQRNGFGFSPKTLMHLASVIVRQNALFGNKNEYSDYLGGLTNLKDIDNELMGETLDNDNLARFCDQFIRNHANSTSLVPNLRETDSTIGGVEIDENTGKISAVEFAVPEDDAYKLYRVRLGKEKPYKFITITRNINGKLFRGLYKLEEEDHEPEYIEDGMRKIRYVAVSTLGLVNNFIEYDANSDLEESYFEGIKGGSFDAVEDEEDTEHATRENDNAQDEIYDDPAAQEKTFKSVVRTLQNAKELNKTAKDRAGYKKYLNKLWDAFQKAEEGSEMAKLFEEMLDKNLDVEKRKDALNRINELIEDQNACNI